MTDFLPNHFRAENLLLTLHQASGRSFLLLQSINCWEHLLHNKRIIFTLEPSLEFGCAILFPHVNSSLRFVQSLDYRARGKRFSDLSPSRYPLQIMVHMMCSRTYFCFFYTISLSLTSGKITNKFCFGQQMLSKRKGGKNFKSWGWTGTGTRRQKLIPSLPRGQQEPNHLSHH